MSNSGRYIVGVALSPELDEMLLAACEELGETPSQFIRKAIVMSLKSQGKDATLSMAAAPSRSGKGGRPSHKSVQRKGKPDATPETSSHSAGPAKPKGKVA